MLKRFLGVLAVVILLGIGIYGFIEMRNYEDSFVGTWEKISDEDNLKGIKTYYTFDKDRKVIETILREREGDSKYYLGDFTVERNILTSKTDEETLTFKYDVYKNEVYKLKDDEIVETFKKTKKEINISSKALIDLPKDYTIEQAIEDGCYVNIHGQISNKEKVQEFYNLISEGKTAFLRMAFVTIEGDVILQDIRFNEDKKFYVLKDNTRDKFSSKEDQVIKSSVYDNFARDEKGNIYLYKLDKDNVNQIKKLELFNINE